MKLGGSKWEFYVRESELFSRAYMRVVASETGHKALVDEVSTVLGSANSCTQFSPSEEWTEVTQLIKVALKKIGKQ